jgi:hypothetical protein
MCPFLSPPRLENPKKALIFPSSRAHKKANEISLLPEIVGFAKLPFCGLRLRQPRFESWSPSQKAQGLSSYELSPFFEIETAPEPVQKNCTHPGIFKN